MLGPTALYPQHMLTVLRKRGKSVALILPDALLRRAGAGVGTRVDLRVEDGTLVITPLGSALTTEQDATESVGT